MRNWSCGLGRKLNTIEDINGKKFVLVRKDLNAQTTNAFICMTAT